MLRKYFLLTLLVLLMIPVFIATHAQEECSSDGTLEQFLTTFVNDSNTPITMYWINTECQEVSPSGPDFGDVGTVIEAGDTLELNTFDGHEFMFRNPNGDGLLRYVVNTLIADGQVSILRTMNEGAAAGAMWATINPARAELGLEPIYFSGILYHVAEEAAEMSGGDFALFGTAIADMGLASEIGWAGNSEGPNSSGVLLSSAELQDIITRSAQGSIDTNDSFGWLDPEVQSFAVYSDENQFGYVFSTMSQPELAVSNPEIMGGMTSIPEISNGSGFLSGGVEMDQYVFEGSGEVLYAISLTSADFDTYLRVYDAEGTEIATNDDGGDGLNSLLTFTAPADGIYTIGVDSFVDQASGYYRLALTHTSEVILNFLSPSASESDNSLDVQEETMYFVSVNSENFDTTVTIIDESSNEIAFNDDGGEGLNSLVVFTATSTGTYTIRVSSFSGVEGDSALEYNILIGTFPN